MVEPMSESEGETGSYSLDATFSALARTDTRRIVGYLSETAPEPVSLETLATVIAASDEAAEDVTDEERRDAAIALHHRYLPSLIAAGLVEHDADADTVTLAEHPALRDRGILEAIGGEAPCDSESLDTLFTALGDERRRTILDVLSHQFGAIHVETLAQELAARARGIAESEVATADTDRELVRLRHADLPHLAEADLVEYDTEAGKVSYTGHPVLRVPWMHSVFEPDFRGSLTGESEPDGIGEIEGRERVVSFGQSVLESAEEELFCMFTDTQLLKAGCLTRIRDAARERDADVYLGTCDPTVREYVEENAPEVVVWEPDANWLNLPVAGDKVGRLLMADREAVMLGTLMEQQSDGQYEEQAIVGEGERDTLVTMICQLLVPYLDQIDNGTEEMEARIPL